MDAGGDVHLAEREAGRAVNIYKRLPCVQHRCTFQSPSRYVFYLFLYRREIRMPEK